MDIPKLVAEWIERTMGIPAEAEPSPGNIREPHFKVSVISFWEEPTGTVFDTEHNFFDDGPTVEGYDTAIQLSIVYHSRSSGEHFRSDFIEQARKNALFFSEHKIIPIIGGKIYGAALDMVGNHIDDIDDHNINDVTGLGYVLSMQRDPGSDVVFEPVTVEGRRGGYIAEQAFLGQVAMRDGAEVVEI